MNRHAECGSHWNNVKRPVVREVYSDGTRNLKARQAIDILDSSPYGTAETCIIPRGSRARGGWICGRATSEVAPPKRSFESMLEVPPHGINRRAAGMVAKFASSGRVARVSRGPPDCGIRAAWIPFDLSCSGEHLGWKLVEIVRTEMAPTAHRIQMANGNPIRNLFHARKLTACCEVVSNQICDMVRLGGSPDCVDGIEGEIDPARGSTTAESPAPLRELFTALHLLSVGCK
ncbi:hypothetical protein K438DRAFT_1760869 [Mycena galopus ATCC 62051]|nr:hypothetical protein K438DRAFT_1760869 [Mycena galopus ATCC 62051]